MVTEGSPEQLLSEGQGQLQEEGKEQLPPASPEGEAAPPDSEAVTSGEEAAPEAQPKTYTQVEVDAEKAKVQSARDIELNQHRARVAELEQSTQQQQQHYDAQTLAARQQRELQDIGDTPEIRAKHQAEQENHQARAWYQQNVPRMAEAEKHQAAYQLSKETGVSMETLLEAKTPDEMRSKAEFLKENVDQGKRIEALEKQITALTQPQTFENAPTSSVGLSGPQKIVDAYAKGDPNVTRPQYEDAAKKLYGG